MALLFVYGSLKQGFANEHVNTGRRVPGRYGTRERHCMYLVGRGEVPCLVLPPGTGHQVVGEVYEVNEDDLRRMDRLERVGEPEGYERVVLAVESLDSATAAHLTVFAYVRQTTSISASEQRIGPLAEYAQEHATRFQWTAAT